jgi:hypothetical protein
VAPGFAHAVACRAGQCRAVAGLASESLIVADVPELPGLPEAVAWSGDGSVGALYSRTAGWIRVFRGWPARVEADPVAWMDAPLHAVAAGAAGKRIAVALGGDRTGVYELDGAANLTALAPSIPAVALAYCGGGQTLFALDTDSKQLAEIDLATSTQRFTAIEGLRDPVALACTRDASGRAQVYVAGRADRAVLILDGGGQRVVDLPFEPPDLAALGAASFSFGSRSSAEDPLWTLRSGAAPRVFFVPALTPPLSGSQAPKEPAQ